jgi:hypothetical protein
MDVTLRTPGPVDIALAAAGVQEIDARGIRLPCMAAGIALSCHAKASHTSHQQSQ